MTCHGKSAGALVYRDGSLLMILRKRGTPGWAPPAGHVDDGENPADAAVRELQEEVGVSSAAVRLAAGFPRTEPDTCSRGTTAHEWWPYLVQAYTGHLRINPDEALAARWVTPWELDRLADLTRLHLVCGTSTEARRMLPGLEPVWLRMLTDMGVIK